MVARERMARGDSRLRRRAGLILPIVSFFAFVGLLAGCKGAAKGPETLVVVSWGGAMQDAQREVIYKTFETKYGVKVQDVSPTDYGKFKAMVDSKNVEWDVADVDADFVPRAVKGELLEPLDFKVIDKTSLEPDLTTDYSVGAEWFALAIGYSTKDYAKGKNPKTWPEFWNTKKFPGKRTLWKYAPGTLETALMADGVPIDKLYPLDVDRAFKSLDRIKKATQVWWTTGAQPAQLLTDNEVSLAAAWNGRITTAKIQGAAVDIDFGQSVLMADVWAVPKGTKHKDLAMKFIAWATAPEQQAAFAKLIPYGPVNGKAFDLLDAGVKAALPSSPDKRANQVILNVKYWFDNYDAINDRFQKWLLE